MFHHDGLYFTDARIQGAQQLKDRPPLKQAWEHLVNNAPTGGLAQIHWSALRCRLSRDTAAGEYAAASLEQALTTPLADHHDVWLHAAETLVLTQCIELLRDHPSADSGWFPAFTDRVEAVHDLAGEPPIANFLWLTALDMAASIVLEDDDVFQDTTAIFRQTIDDELHPEGYFPKAVEAGPEVEALRNQIRAVQAMVLMAEMAAHQGIDLWKYENRGVSVLTAATYPLYYYFYPEKWQWNGDKWKPSDGVPEQDAKQIFRQHPGYLEMAATRYDKPLKAINMILDEVRPVYDLYGSGFVTLTHAQPQRRRLLGTF